VIDKYVIGAPRAELLWMPVARRWRGASDFEPIGEAAVSNGDSEAEQELPPAVVSLATQQRASLRSELQRTIAHPVFRRLARGALRPLPGVMRRRVRHSLLGALNWLER